MNEKLKILDELRDLIPPLNTKELDNLHNSLEVEGRAIEPIIVWKQENVIVDGHHRYDHCSKNGLGYDVKKVSFPSIGVAKNWMIINQLSRRNLDPKEASRLRGMLFNARKKSVGGQEDNINASKRIDQNDLIESTAAAVAKETGVGEATVKRDGKFAEACDAITSMETNGVITKEEKKSIMKKPKSQIINVADSPTEAKKVVAETKPKPRRQAYEVVVEKFNKLKFDQMKKAVHQIDKIWSAQ